MSICKECNVWNDDDFSCSGPGSPELRCLWSKVDYCDECYGNGGGRCRSGAAKFGAGKRKLLQMFAAEGVTPPPWLRNK